MPMMRDCFGDPLKETFQWPEERKQKRDEKKDAMNDKGKADRETG